MSIKLGIKSRRDYARKYQLDIRLMSSPSEFYSDFPGWGIFLRTGRNMRTEKEVYLKWEDASQSAKKTGANDCKDYKKKYKIDPKLPSSPDRFYGKDFPGWGTFLGTGNPRFKRRDKEELYQTWDEVAIVITSLGIKSGAEYKKRYQEDSFLPANPWIVYDDFPGWTKFFGKL